MATDCCKVEYGIGCAGDDCDTERQSGLRDLRAALKCYVLATLETAWPDTYVIDIIMNTLANNPTGGDDDSAFYSICTQEKTLAHTFEWTCAEDTNNKSFSETITGQMPTRNSRAFTILKNEPYHHA